MLLGVWHDTVVLRGLLVGVMSVVVLCWAFLAAM